MYCTIGALLTKGRADLVQKIQAVISSDSSFVRRVLEDVKDTLIGHGFGNRKIKRILDNAFKPYEIYFKEGTGQSSDRDWRHLGIRSGRTFPDLKIQIEYTKDFWKTFKDDDSWDLFMEVLSRLVAHELVHRAQIQKMIKKLGPEWKKITHYGKGYKSAVEYLRNPQELMSRAHDAVDELLVNFPRDEIEERLKSFSETTPGYWHSIVEDSDTLEMYTRIFSKRDPVFKRLFKYMYQYLQTIK